jgi:hypothetical protein
VFHGKKAEIMLFAAFRVIKNKDIANDRGGTSLMNSIKKFNWPAISPQSRWYRSNLPPVPETEIKCHDQQDLTTRFFHRHGMDITMGADVVK